MKQWWKVTVGVTLGLVLIAVGWDIFVAVTPEVGDTISELTLRFSGVTPALPFACGVLTGHLFWPNRYHAGWFALLALIPTIGLGLWGWLSTDIIITFLAQNPIIPVLLGVPVGHYVWPQKEDADA